MVGEPISIEAEAELPGDVLHFPIFGKDFAGDTMEFLCASYFDQAAEEFRTQPVLLERVTHNKGRLGFIRLRRSAQSAQRNKFALTGTWILVLRHQNYVCIPTRIECAPVDCERGGCARGVREK
jgi:hypothetical protein